MLGFLLWRELLSQMMIALPLLIRASWGETHLSCEALKCCSNGNHGSTIDRRSLVLAHIRLLLPSSERGMFALIKRCLSQEVFFCVFSSLSDSYAWNGLSFSSTVLSKSFLGLLCTMAPVTNCVNGIFIDSFVAGVSWVDGSQAASFPEFRLLYGLDLVIKSQMFL